MSPIRYNVGISSPQTHYAELEAHIPLAGTSELEVFLPVWTPGSYLVREYARHIESLAAVDSRGRPLSVTKTRKNRWRVTSPEPLEQVIVSYRLYCHELSVRTNWIDGTFALLVGAATFLCVINELERNYEVTLDLPPEWLGCWSGLPGTGTTFTALDYDTLVDCPILAGSAMVQSFDIGGRPHLLVNMGDSSLWDLPSAARDVEQIARQHLSMWGGEPPYEKYLFLNLLTGGSGGLEHRNSMVVMSDRFAPRTRASYVAWLHLVSHEYFHVWNVKRLRPLELGPFDYENEVYTRNLWIAEGFTEYYGILGLRRTGLITDDEFLGAGTRGKPEHGSLSRLVEDLQTTPGRLRMPVSLASFDAWIKLYRPDDNSVNSSISYYVKGAVIAWLLDMKLRSTSGDVHSLDDIVRLAWHRFGREKGFSTQEFLDTVQEFTEANLDDWFSRAIDSTEELDYGEAMAWLGLRFRPRTSSNASPGPGAALPKAWAGFSSKVEAGRLIVTRVPQGTPAWEAGISPNDEIVGVNEYRLNPDGWDRLMEQYRPDEQVSLLISRRERLQTVPVRLGEDSSGRWGIDVDPDASEAQREHFQSWVSSVSLDTKA